MKWIKPLVFLLFVATFVLDGYQVYRIAFVKHYADFPAYLAGAEGFRDGTNPYFLRAIPPYSGDDIRPFIYPLFVAWLWVPFTFVPAVAASFIWYCASFAMLLYAIYIVARVVGLKKSSHLWIVFGSIGILFISVFQWVLMFGQMDIFELLLLVLAVKYLVRDQAKGGAFLGTAISAKLMPIVVGPMLLRNWKALLIAISTVVLVCIVIPYIIAGSSILGYYDYWFHTTLGTEMAKGDSSVHSFALAGVVAQFLGLERPSIAIKLACGIFLMYFPLRLLFKERMLPALLLSFMLIPLTSTRSEPNHLTMFVPGVIFIISILLNGRVWWKGTEVLMSQGHTMTGWIGLLVIQMMVLWGYNAVIPFDTIGMLLLFFLLFWQAEGGNHAKI